MKADFICPQCRGYMSVDDRVVFTIRGKNRKTGILFLSPVLGDYTYSSSPSFKIVPGEKIDFLCPICHADLTIAGSDSLARVIMKEDDRYEYFIVFSKKEGERCTFKLSEKSIEHFGEHAQVHIDFVAASLLK